MPFHKFRVVFKINFRNPFANFLTFGVCSLIMSLEVTSFINDFNVVLTFKDLQTKRG